MTTAKLLSDDELREIRERVKNATAGPWCYFGWPHDSPFWGEIRSVAEQGSFDHITDTPELDERDNDMEFIANAREDIPALLDHVDALTAQLQQVTEQRDRQRIRYPHFCCDGHVNIGHDVSDDDERCPLCRVLNDRDQLRQQLTACEQERDRYKSEVELADAEIVERAAQLSAKIVIDGSIDEFRSQLVKAVRAKADRRSAFYREAKVHDEVAEFIEQFQVS